MSIDRTDGPFLLANAASFVGRELALSDWVEIDQEMVDGFGKVTYWDTWMHCDPQRCVAESPYGGTLIHGFHVTALVSHFMEISGLRPSDGRYSLNYGTDKVRVLQPVIIGDGVKLRDRISLLKVDTKADGAILLVTAHQVECDKNEGPIAYIEFLNLWYPVPSQSTGGA